MHTNHKRKGRFEQRFHSEKSLLARSFEPVTLIFFDLLPYLPADLSPGLHKVYSVVNFFQDRQETPSGEAHPDGAHERRAQQVQEPEVNLFLLIWA